MTYIKLLETFVFTVLMDKNEYNFFHKNFRPVKLLIILFLVGNLFFTGYLLARLDRVHEVLVLHCPAIFEITKVPAPVKKK